MRTHAQSVGRLKIPARLVWWTAVSALACALALSACGPFAGEETAPAAESGTPAAATAAPAGESGTPAAETTTPAGESDAPAPTAAPVQPSPVQTDPREFAADATRTGGNDNPEASIENIRFGRHEEFERLVIDFASARTTAADVPRWRIEKAAAPGVLRVHLSAVTATDYTDGVFDGDLLTRAYVVRAADRSLFVDVFIPAGFQYRVLELGDPLRLVIDVRASGAETYLLPVHGERVVLLIPAAGAAITSPLTVSGNSRHFEANNVLILQDSMGHQLALGIATANDYVETWGYFAGELTFAQFAGTGALAVGEQDARDGKFIGVTIPVQYGGS